MTLLDIARWRVRRGIERLDSVDPAWRGKVPAERIDMRKGRVSPLTGCGCILAHWKGGYCDGAIAIGSRHSDPELVKNGFVIDLRYLRDGEAEEDGDTTLGEPGWRDLDLAWTEAIRGGS